jgi:Ribbon-helix-helix protein, copG family
MRTTLSIDDDVAATLQRLRRAGDKSLKELVNEALRQGLRELAAPAKPRKPFRTKSVSLGPCLIGDIVSISEAIAIAEGEGHR